MAQKKDKNKEEEIQGPISDEEFHKIIKENLRKDKKLLEKLAKI